MFKTKRKPGHLVGSDLDWFVIPIRTLGRLGIILVLLAAAIFLAYTTRARLSPEERAKKEIASATDLVHRASLASGTARPGSRTRRAARSKTCCTA